MTLCLNRDCLGYSPPDDRFCQNCGATLKLGDRYRATRIIGEGAFGRTFMAVDEQRLNRSCVIFFLAFFLFVSTKNAIINYI